MDMRGDLLHHLFAYRRTEHIQICALKATLQLTARSEGYSVAPFCTVMQGLSDSIIP